MTLQLHTRHDEPATVTVVLAGALDLATRDQLLDAARAAFDGSAAHRLLDLGEVDFMDSTGLGAVVLLAGEAREAGAELRISRTSHAVRRILQLTGLEETLAPPG